MRTIKDEVKGSGEQIIQALGVTVRTFGEPLEGFEQRSDVT